MENVEMKKIILLTLILIKLQISLLQQICLQSSMLPNNQCKQKQIKSITVNFLTSKGKSKSKDSLRILQTKRIGASGHKDSKLKHLRKNKQQQPNSKQKEKNRQTKNVHQEYYIQQKRAPKPHVAPELQKHKKSKSNSNFLFESNENQGGKCEKLKRVNEDEFQKTHKISFSEARNVITFDGKVIKMPPKESKGPIYHNYTSVSSYHDAQDFTNEVLQEKQIKIKSKQKNRKNTQQKGSIKKKYKPTHKHHKSQSDLPCQSPILPTIDQQFHKPNLMAEETQNSPTKERQYQRNQKFDFEQIYELIEEDLQTVNDVKINIEINKPRKQCLKFLSQICGELSLRRETFYLSISIFDRALSRKMTIENYKLLALVSLTLAMKLEQARLSQQFIHALGVVNSGKESYLESVSSCKSVSKPKSITARSKKSGETNSISKKWKHQKISIKQENINKISIASVAKLLRKYSISKISKTQFMQLEQKVTVYLRFRLWRIQAIFWTDLLTCLWDQHIIAGELSMHTNSSLLFRCSVSLINISYLYQILEMAYLHENVYVFPSIHIVLSAMYLLVRITKQGTENGYQFYRQSLATSTNLIFVDKTGINQIFWLFLDKLKIQMVDILSCCQFISHFLQPDLMKCTIANQESKESVDNGLSIHQFNSNLYLSGP